MRALWIVAGLVSVATGMIGIFVPLLPTVPLMILAAFCFGKSSPRLPVGDLESDGRALEARFRTWVEFAYPTEQYIARTFLEKSKKPEKKESV